MQDAAVWRSTMRSYVLGSSVPCDAAKRQEESAVILLGSFGGARISGL